MYEYKYDIEKLHRTYDGKELEKSNVSKNGSKE